LGLGYLLLNVYFLDGRTLLWYWAPSGGSRQRSSELLILSIITEKRLLTRHDVSGARKSHGRESSVIDGNREYQKVSWSYALFRHYFM